MDPHRLAEERSLAYHEVVARLLVEHPERLSIARQRVQTWMQRYPEGPPRYAVLWADILNGSIDEIISILRDRSELGRELRQSSPFAGFLSPQERWQLWKRVERDWQQP